MTIVGGYHPLLRVLLLRRKAGYGIVRLPYPRLILVRVLRKALLRLLLLDKVMLLLLLLLMMGELQSWRGLCLRYGLFRLVW